MKHKPSDRYEVRGYYSDSYECVCPVVVAPDGTEVCRFDNSVVGSCEAEAHCDELNRKLRRKCR